MDFTRDEPMVSVSTRLPPAIVQSVVDLASEKGIKEGAVLRQIVIAFFSQNRLQNGDVEQEGDK